jgi:hypothetical protein
VKGMKKVLIVLLVAGFLLVGTCAVEKICEETSSVKDFSGPGDLGEPEGGGDPAPCGGGSGAGPGGIPG